MLSQDDIDYINNQRIFMEPTYNKVQYSEFTPDRVGQWVLRGDTIQEVLDLREELFGKATRPVAQTVMPAPVVAPAAQTTPNFIPSPQAQNTSQYPDLTPDQTITKYGLTDMLALQMRTPCTKCGGGKAYNSKTGKVFCKAKCWLK